MHTGGGKKSALKNRTAMKAGLLHGIIIMEKVKMYPTLGMLMCQHHTCSIIFAARYWGALYVPDINTTYARRNPNRFVTFPRRYDPIPDER